jgi:hypothetical protein
MLQEKVWRHNMAEVLSQVCQDVKFSGRQLHGVAMYSHLLLHQVDCEIAHGYPRARLLL